MGIHATEESTLVLDVSLFDENGVLVTPTSAQWSLTDGGGTAINSRTDVPVAPLASEFSIVLSGADLGLAVGETSPAKRVLLVEFEYDSDLGSDLPAKRELVFFVDELVSG